MAWESQLNRIRAASSTKRPGPAHVTQDVKYGSGSKYLVVKQSAAELAKAAGLSLDEYALAACAQSEYGRGEPHLLLAACEVMRNRAKAAGMSPYDRLTYESKADRLQFKGRFGEQFGRVASTRVAPSEKSIVAARIALNERTEIIGDATSWFEPAAQDSGAQRGRKIRRADEIVLKWAEDGFEWIGPREHFNPYVLMAFHEVTGRRPEVGPALREIEIGRGKRRPDGKPRGPWAAIAGLAGIAAAELLAGKLGA